MAAFLNTNTLISGFDYLFLSLWHSLNCGFLTFIFKVITFLGEKGIIFFLIALACMMFSKTRKFGICLFGAVACGALITNVMLKDAVERLRPFESSETFRQWWQAVGSPTEDGFSFPSGHATAAAAGCTAIYLMKGKKWLVPGIVWVVLMMIARNYLMAHYPTDVICGTIIGIASGFIAWYITQFIYNVLNKNRNTKWGRFCLEWDVPVKLPEIKLPSFIKNTDISFPTRANTHEYVGKHEKR